MSQVNVELPEFVGDEFAEKVIEAAARQLLQYHTIGDGESDTLYTVPTELQRRLRDHIDGVIREEAREHAPAVAAEILEQGVRRTNTWGDPTGERVPLKTVIAEEVKKSLVHSSGSRGEGTLSKLLREEVQRQLGGELRAMIEEARKPILEAVRTEAQSVFEQAMKKALGDSIRF